MALAYFLTWTTYGTWLHGNAKGSVDKQHNVFETPLLPEEMERARREEQAMVQPAYLMDETQRAIVCKAIVNLARERHWRLWAVHVRANHVHVVVTVERDPGRLLSDFKGRASRDLTRAGFDNVDRKRWTRHGSTRHLFREGDVEAAITYTLDEQGDRMAWYADESRKEPPEEPRTQ